MSKTTSTLKTKNSRIIEIEELSGPEELLPEVNSDDLMAKHGQNVQASCDLPSKLVDLGSHTFIAGMYRAYAEHRPFTISPEMIWLLIQQGISMHLYRSMGSVTKFYPELLEKKSLEISRDKVSFGQSDWEAIAAEFVDVMQDYLDQEFIDQFRLNFSASTQEECTVGDLMIMDAMSPYFEYIIFSLVCGIPRVELQGTSGDWDKILQKLTYFRKFDLDWWFDHIEPIITQIKASADGVTATDFWMNMFKVHTKKEYGEPKVIDGWIMNFYPFDKTGRRIIGKELKKLSVEKIFNELPPELKIIPFKIRIADPTGEVLKEQHLEFTAGFVGLSQDPSTMRLRPEIGWLVGDKTDKRIPEERPNGFIGGESREYFTLEEFPQELLSGEEFGDLILHFKREIKYPEELECIKATRLTMNGIVPEGMLEDLQEKFKGSMTMVILNYYNEIYGEGKEI